MGKDWWRRLLDEGTVPALALAFAVSQSPWGDTGLEDKVLPFHCPAGELPTAARPVLPTVEWWASEASVAGSTVVRAGVNAPRAPL